MSAAAAQPVAAAAAAAAAPAPAPSSSSRAAGTPSDVPDLSREARFYGRGAPQQFLDDVANAAADYLADACDSLEKLIGQKALLSSSSSKKSAASSKADKELVGRAVDLFYTAANAELEKALPSFERAAIDAVLRIPANVVVRAELLAAADGFGAHQALDAASASAAGAVPGSAADLTEQEEREAEEYLRALQLRLIRNAKNNRALRTEGTVAKERCGDERTQRAA
jgi:hypothetical protein